MAMTLWPHIIHREGTGLQMGDGCELDVQSAAAFAQRNEELSYWQLQVPLIVLWPDIS